MKLKNVILTGVTALSLGMIVNASTANAAKWHTSAIPQKLCGCWRAKDNYHYVFKITKYTFKYSGEKTSKKVKWRYLGKNKYSLKDKNGSIIHVHYIGRHKLTSNSYWHTYRK